MCSATQKGFRVRRSKEEMRELRVARSDIGPGKPYWKRPAGSTGEGVEGVVFGGVWKGEGPGIEGAELEVDVEAIVVVVVVWSFLSEERVEYIAAVTPAPVAALTAAIIANVVFDILKPI